MVCLFDDIYKKGGNGKLKLVYYYSNILYLYYKMSKSIKENMQLLVDLVECMSVNLQRSFSKPRVNESTAECYRVLRETGNDTMKGYFPENLDILFVQVSHPSKRYSTYFFQRRTMFWQKMVDCGEDKIIFWRVFFFFFIIKINCNF
jgi:hypothetical protein